MEGDQTKITLVLIDSILLFSDCTGSKRVSHVLRLIADFSLHNW